MNMLETKDTLPFQIVVGDPADPSVAQLLRRSENYAYSLYPPESVHLLPVSELTAPHVRFLVARDVESDEVLGCCAVVLQDDVYAELKRMYVDAPIDMRAMIRAADSRARRRRGVGAELMRAAEEVARIAQIRTIRFETGPEQPHAIALGRRFGYSLRGPYSDYPDDPNSVFMEKVLVYESFQPQNDGLLPVGEVIRYSTEE